VVVVKGRNFSWYKVALPKEADCYVYADFVKRISETLGLVKANRLNVRGGPGTKFGILGQLKRGEQIIIKKKEGEWYKIFPTDTIYGWIHKDYLEYAGSAKDFLEEKRLRDELEKKIEKLEKDYQKSLTTNNRLISLNKIVKKLESLQSEYSNFKEIVARLQDKKDTIMQKIESYKLKERNFPWNENIVEAEGKIEELGRFFGKKGTHKLIKDSKTVFYLESNDINLDTFSGCRVKVWGVVEENDQRGEPLLRVEKVAFNGM
jgi:SH3-like domain-containing protein